MRWIGTNGIASFKQLYIVFWPQAKERTCQERLLQLEKAGWIERHYVDTDRKRGEQVYTLTSKGAKEHFEEATRRRMMIGLPAPGELKQQLMAQDTRIVLERSLAEQGGRLVGWQNERELRSEAALARRKPLSRAWGGLPDLNDARAFFTTPSNTENITTTTGNHNSGTGQVQSLDIEIDGQYYGQMLKKKIVSLARGNRPTLWVTTPDRVRQIQRELTEAGEPTNIHLLIINH